MNIYHVWFNLIDSHKDIELSRKVAADLNHLKDQGKIESRRLTRRKFGFGPDGLGEFHAKCIAWTSRSSKQISRSSQRATAKSSSCTDPCIQA